MTVTKIAENGSCVIEKSVESIRDTTVIERQTRLDRSVINCNKKTMSIDIKETIGRLQLPLPCKLLKSHGQGLGKNYKPFYTIINGNNQIV